MCRGLGTELVKIWRSLWKTAREEATAIAQERASHIGNIGCSGEG